ncbi:hypothetical protein [Mesorhizobium sp. B2-8-9]|uniref:hypothetical protein n=1 Tax=Mesorhizobium sp. B2-8-9 TaxID=2589899 RepID=UPI001FEFAE1B|nr:hypothetical protein [Mesorhizobium sp. B2-8-9]
MPSDRPPVESPINAACWALVVLIAHLLFRSSGLYNTVWRFASTPDFFNILKGSGSLTVVLYLASLAFRFFFQPVAGLNERQFIVFFLVCFTIISAPTLCYRFLRYGASWSCAAPAVVALRRAWSRCWKIMSKARKASTC